MGYNINTNHMKITLKNTNKDTKTLARLLSDYVVSKRSYTGFKDLTALLIVDNEQAEIHYEEAKPFTSVWSENDSFNSLVKKIPDAQHISLDAKYNDTGYPEFPDEKIKSAIKDNDLKDLKDDFTCEIISYVDNEDGVLFNKFMKKGNEYGLFNVDYSHDLSVILSANSWRSDDWYMEISTANFNESQLNNLRQMTNKLDSMLEENFTYYRNDGEDMTVEFSNPIFKSEYFDDALKQMTDIFTFCDSVDNSCIKISETEDGYYSLFDDNGEIFALVDVSIDDTFNFSYKIKK